MLNVTKVNKYLVGILNLWIVLSTKYTKLNVQPKNMILQYRESAFPTSKIPAVYARREGNRHFLLGLTTVWLS